MDGEHHQRITRYRESTEPQVERNVYDRHVRMYEHAAHERGVRPVVGGVWCKADGMRYMRNETVEHISYNTDGSMLPPSRLEKVGTYDYNNGIVAYVDSRGELWIGRSTDENFAALHEAGYRKGSMWVPFSNGERVLDADDRAAFLDARTGKHIEDIHRERNERVAEIQAEYQMLFGAQAQTPDAYQLYAEQRERLHLESPKKIVEHHLPSHIEGDEHTAHIRHRVYSAGELTFSFQQTDQLPRYSTNRSRSTEILGAQWNATPKEKAAEYTTDIANNINEKHHYQAVASVRGVVELVSRLLPHDTSLQQLAEEMNRGVYSERALAIADSIIAAQYGSDGYAELYTHADSYGLPLVVLALAGEPQSQRLLIERLHQMRRYDAMQKEKLREKIDTEPLHIEELLVMHATNYAPEETDDGLGIQSTFDATHGSTLRNSIHTTFNHRVAAHSYGSWDDAAFTLLSPLSEVITHNGLPRSLVTVDTYWTQDPGKKFVFPHGVLVGPGRSDQKELIHTEGKKVFYKPFPQRSDSEAIYTQLKDANARTTYANRLQEAVVHEYAMSMTSLELMRRHWNVDGVCRALREELTQSGGRSFMEAFRESNRTSFFAMAQEWMKLDALRQYYTGAPEEYQLNCDRYATMIATRLMEVTRQTLNSMVVDQTITQLGYTIQTGGMWAWADDWGVTRRTRALAGEIGTHSAAHTHMPEHHLTDSISRSQHHVQEARKSDPNASSLVDISSFVPEVDPATRRMIAASGYLSC